MIWLTWRQHRKQFLYALLGIALLAAVLIPTGISLHNGYSDQTLLNHCRETYGSLAKIPNGQQEDFMKCEDLAQRFTSKYESLRILIIVFIFLPLLVGLFLGAPLVAREVEQGTHRFIWTQGVSRMRWALVKIGMVGAGALILGGLYTALTSWWVAPFTWLNEGRIGSPYFDVQMVVPLAYTIFAFALGVFAGAVWRRTLAAMAATLVSFIVVRFTMMFGIRERLFTPTVEKFPINGGRVFNHLGGSWMIGEGVYSKDGKLILANGSVGCPPSDRGGDECTTRFGAGAYNQLTYFPAEKFWAFQLTESAIMLGLSVLLLVAAVWQIRRTVR